MHVLRRLHCVGVVTNGSVRDIPAARSAGFHYFAGSVAVSHGYVHIVDFGQPVEIGGLKVASGELLHGDLHGVQSVPLSIAPQLPAVGDCDPSSTSRPLLRCAARPISHSRSYGSFSPRCRPKDGIQYMSRFAIRFPYFIIVICLIICVVGVTSLVRMPVDLFPPINIPVVVVATFFSGMPPEQIETDITGRFERFFTLASGIDHIESRSLPGVSLIKVYFQPGTNPDSAVTTIANLAHGRSAHACRPARCRRWC